MTFSNSPSPGIALQGGGGSGGAGASAPLTGTGATVTTSQPLIDVSQTWNNAAVTFTSLKLNITATASNAASLLMDLGTGGGSFVSKFSVRQDGSVIAPLGSAATPSLGMGTGSSGLYSRSATLRLNFAIAGSDAGIEIGSTVLALQNTASLSWASGLLPSSGLDTHLTRRGTANLRLGAADAAAPVAQTLSVQSVVAGTTNTAGTNLTITGSQGTGTGAGGSLIFQVAPAGSSGSAQNALATALTIDSTKLATFAGNVGLYSSTDFRIGSSSVNWQVVATTTYIGQSSNNFYGFYNGTNLGSAGSLDVRLYRDDANTLALRNGTTAQTFRVYNTFTDASNYERGGMQWSGGAFQVGVLGTAGTGSPTRSIQFLVNNGAHVWNFSTAGHFLSAADNAYDIGAVSATRPRSVYVGTSITPGAGVVVASLPTPTTGMIARVTDALAPTIGTTVASGGAAYALVNYNGANWTVIGV